MQSIRLSYEEWLTRLNIDALEFRSKIDDTTLMYKAATNEINLSISDLLEV